MSECKICGTDCQWTFCVDCQKLVKQGINAYEHQVADLTAKLKLAVEALEHYSQHSDIFKRADGPTVALIALDKIAR